MQSSQISAARSILKDIQPNSIIGCAVVQGLKSDEDVLVLIDNIKSAYADNAKSVEKIIGKGKIKQLFKL